MVRILVCGGRDYADWLCLRNTLDKICFERGYGHEVANIWMPNVVIISGKAKGADQLAIHWAVLNHCSFEEYPADWKQYGKKAGPIRNQQMIDEGKPDLVVAFPGGVGTKDMIRRSKKANIEVMIIGNTWYH